MEVRRAIRKLLQKALRMPGKNVAIGMERQSYETIQTAYGVHVWRRGGGRKKILIV